MVSGGEERGETRREDGGRRAARLISSCPSYGPGGVNELASRQGPTDLLSCSTDSTRWKETDSASL